VAAVFSPAIGYAAVDFDKGWPLGARPEPDEGAVRPVSVEIAAEASVPKLRPKDFDSFYRMSWQAVYRPLAATLGDADLAAEAVDEAMVRAFSRWTSLRRVQNLEGWAYRVAYRWSVDRLRRRQRERGLMARVGTRDSNHELLVEPGLQPALGVLPIEQRAVVILACAFDWSEADIAACLQIRPGTVKSRLHRGLATLRKEMGA
jgi:RNA polymerase sigma factor (sigma-70 family)